MSTTLKTDTVEVKKRGSYRRLLVVTALVIFGSLAVWMIWGAIRDWTDARALEGYYAELEQREPGWRDRVYGKELTAAQINDHQKWIELQRAMDGNKNAWGVYRQGSYQGMYQDPARPTAQLPSEQVEFMKAAHQYWQSVFEKLAPIEKLPGVHRLIDRNAPYDKMLAQSAVMYGSTNYLLNEGIEFEVMYHIMMNDPEHAVKWLLLCRSPTYGYRYYLPFLVEHLLNMTQPKATTLIQLQQLIEKKARWAEEYGFPGLGSELRLMEQSIRELAYGDLTNAQIDRRGVELGLLGRDSAWNTSFLGWLRPFYLKSRIGNIFQRPNLLILRLHQLADQVETLGKIDPGKRWSTWTHFAETQSIRIEPKSYGTQPVPSKYPDAIPEGLYLLRARYLHWQMILQFDQQAQLNTALTAVMAERYRLDHGRFPADWSELVPRYVAKPVIDPYSGKPLQIKPNEKGIVIYSVGNFGKDEGGEYLNTLHYWNYGGIATDPKNTNQGIRVYLPALRRGPAFVLDKDLQGSLKEYTAELLKLMKEGKE